MKFLRGDLRFNKAMTMGTTPLVFFICMLTLMIYDFIEVTFLKGTTGSVSNFLINSGINSPTVSGGFFLCMGHLFFYMTPEEEWGGLTESVRRKLEFRGAICGAVVGIGLWKIGAYVISLL